MAVFKVKHNKKLSRLEFVRLCKKAGGTTNEMLVSAKSNANTDLQAMWIMLEMSSEVRKNDPEIVAGLELLHGLGYLPNGPQAVLKAWPTE